jgi:hypothetical protein
MQEKGNTMSLKLKVLGMGVLTTLALSAIAVVNASAERTGHFTHDAVGNAKVTGTENGTHIIKFHSDHGTPIECTTAEYHAEISNTTDEIQVTPTWSNCHTENSTTNIPVHVNGCKLKFTSNTKASVDPPETHATAGLVCPEGVAGIVVTHPNCTMRMPPQTVNHAVTYSTINLNEKHAITLNVTANTSVTAHYEGGICVFLGTTHQGSMTGSATVHARNQAGEPVNLTAT